MAKEKESNILSLSEALLAPLNSIFKAQVHASRAFLNFLLQMGFRHKYTDEDILHLKANPSEESTATLAEIEKEKEDKARMVTLKDRLAQLNSLKELTNEEETEKEAIQSSIKEIRLRWNSLHQQEIEYLDQNGVDRTIFIPNLSLLPIKPLGIQQANFKYEMRVTDSSKSASTVNPARMASPNRPWFLIEPKSIEGEFSQQQKEGSSDKTIKIEITVGAMDMPYGLHKLLSSLTNIAQDSEKSTLNETN